MWVRSGRLVERVGRSSAPLICGAIELSAAGEAHLVERDGHGAVRVHCEVSSLVADDHRAIAAEGSEREGKRRVRVAFVEVEVAPDREVTGVRDIAVGPGELSGLGEGHPDLVAAGEERDVLNRVAVDRDRDYVA